jgi:hypothetical protein
VGYFCFPLDRKYVATHSNEKAVILYSAIRTEKPQTEAVVNNAAQQTQAQIQTATQTNNSRHSGRASMAAQVAQMSQQGKGISR